MFLEYYNTSLGQWIALKVWQGTGTGFTALDGYRAINSGYNYRVRTVGYVYNADNVLVEVVSASDYAYY